MARANNLFLLAFLVLAVALAGCTTGNGTQGTPTESEGKGLQIEGPECHPLNAPESDCGEINEFQNVVVTLTVKNTGSTDIKIPFSIRQSFGGSEAYKSLSAATLRNRCPSIFSAQRSSVSVDKITPAAVYTYEKQRDATTATIDSGFFSADDSLSVSLQDFIQTLLQNDGFFSGTTAPNELLLLQPGQRLEFEWVMRLRDRDRLESGFKCPLAFELKTIQTVSGTRRIQIKSSRDVQDIGSFTAKSSASPMHMQIDAPNSWVVDEDEFPAQVYLNNNYDNVGSPSELIKLSNSNIVADIGDEPLLECSLEYDPQSPLDRLELRMLQDGSGETTRKTFLCDALSLPSGTDSQTAVLSSSATFWYNYERKTIEITICKQGDRC